MIYLLDLNYTLVTNSLEKKDKYIDQINQELYDEDLVNFLKGKKVILITARPEKYKDVTMLKISRDTSLDFINAYFNIYNLPPYMLKGKIFKELIQPLYKDETFFAIESNPRTRGVYKTLGIDSMDKVTFKINFINHAK